MSKFNFLPKKTYTHSVNYWYRQSMYEKGTISVCTMLLGILLLLPLNMDMTAYSYLAGVTALLCALFSLITYKRTGYLVNIYAGIMSISLLATAILCFVTPIYAQVHFGTFMGAFIIIDALHSLSTSLCCYKWGMEGSFTYILSNILVLLAGIMLLFETKNRLMLSAGICLLIFSIVKIGICSILGKEIIQTYYRKSHENFLN